MNGSTAVFEELRPLLFSIAYRMVASVADTEDILQEAFLRYHRRRRHRLGQGLPVGCGDPAGHRPPPVGPGPA
jgi:DNA-directed RNA polymerase specialized sigma24 family protein